MDTLASRDQFPNMNTLTITLPGADLEIIRHSEMNSKLPPELHSHIIDHIDDKPTLLSLLVSSKSVHSQAERKLYHSIKLAKSTSHQLFLESILDPKRPHLARLIHHYFLSQAPIIDNGFNTLLTRALVTLINLKSLSFRGMIGIQSAQVLPTGAPCPFQLRAFHWFGGMDISLLGPFLDGQHSLEVLWLFSVPNLTPVSSSSTRNLRKLSGTTNVIANFVPGSNSVKCIDWSAPTWPTAAINASFISSFSHVRILSFGIRSAWPLLDNMLVLLEHLDILELGAFYGTELGNLYKLTRLHTLVISGRDYGVSINPPETFNEMKALERIDLGYFVPPQQSLMYKR